MEKLVKEFNCIENSVARYIYLKYIQHTEIQSITNISNINNNTLEHDDTNEENTDEESNITETENPSATTQSTTIANEHNQSKVKIRDKKIYRLYLKNIFNHKRKCFVINQEDLIHDDLRTMEIANKAYERNPKEFKISNFNLPPDVLRCSFIRKHNHRYYRCKNRISGDDSDVCKKHEEHENIYYDKYNELLEQFL